MLIFLICISVSAGSARNVRARVRILKMDHARVCIPEDRQNDPAQDLNPEILGARDRSIAEKSASKLVERSLGLQQRVLGQN